MIISIVNQKGGVGKTTTAVNLGAALARLGETVLLVDLDPQGNATSGLGVPEEHRQPGIYEALRGEVPIEEILQPTTFERFNIVPSTPDLAGASVELLNDDRRDHRLRHVLQSLTQHFSVILIDSPPSLGILTMNSLVAADRVLIPVQSEYYALEGLGQLLQTITLVKEHLHPSLEVLGAVLTLYDRRVRVAREVVDEVHEHFPGHVFDTVIPRNVRLAEAPSYGQSIFEYDKHSQGARAYEAFAQEVRTRMNVVATTSPAFSTGTPTPRS